MPELNGFWLESSLKISPKEQVEVLSNIFNGKTGTGGKYNAWFVGMLENGSEKYSFAVHLNDGKGNEISGQKAKEIALKIISQYYK